MIKNDNGVLFVFHKCSTLGTVSPYGIKPLRFQPQQQERLS